ncbi:MAG: hypothetical protein NVS4B12_08150 [Ktedonobacteraceae bacterium]
MHVVSAFVSFAQLDRSNIKVAFLTFSNMIVITLWITGFLCALNIGLAILYRRKQAKEVVSYYAAFVFELIIFVFALLLHIGIITRVPFPLPPGLPFNRAEIGATIAIGIGLLPATFWHRTSFSEVGARMAEDAKTMNDRDGGVKIGRKSTPGEWMN